MTEGDRRHGAASAATAATPTTATTAGAMLRAARESQGMHIALLAAAIKVSPRKLDALEHDRYDELTDATFVRALAQTVCRALKIDAAPVLALLPQSNVSLLGAANAGLNTPFRDRPGRGEPASTMPQRPLIWAGLLLVIAAVLIAFAPASVWQWVVGDEPAGGAAVASASAAAAVAASASAAMVGGGPAALMASPVSSTGTPLAGAAAAAASVAAPMVETVHAVPSDRAVADGAPNAATLSASEASWIEVVDASGATLLSRLLPPGETVTLQGPLPLKLKIGNARATQVVFRGQAVDLLGTARDNVARLELK